MKSTNLHLNIALLLLFSVSSIAQLAYADPRYDDSTTAINILPPIAGQWEIQLDYPNTLTNAQNSNLSDRNLSSGNLNNNGSSDNQQDDKVGSFDNNQTLHAFYDNNPRVDISPPSTDDTRPAEVTTKAQCRELYNFGGNNNFLTVSGKEWTLGQYFIQYKEEGLPMLFMKTIYDNNELDCSGNKIDQSGDGNIAFLDHQDRVMRWCNDAEGQDCPMLFYKVLP